MRKIFFNFLSWLFANRMFRLTKPESIKPGQVIIRAFDKGKRRGFEIAASTVIQSMVCGITSPHYCSIYLGDLNPKYIHVDYAFLNDVGVIPYVHGQWNESNRTYIFPLRLSVGVIKKLIPLCYNQRAIGKDFQLTDEGSLITMEL